ncbi:hypothetical protein E2C01_018477 [Portunus trituberculatus]|uniref:Secreted protein n=1 Tax=Portunus trituberculatus TaxID=210409 RepID=A0A5B7DV89_PORTR|nr:hypothetical protein [Portunus trituberculatus]
MTLIYSHLVLMVVCLGLRESSDLAHRPLCPTLSRHHEQAWRGMCIVKQQRPHSSFLFPSLPDAIGGQWCDALWCGDALYRVAGCCHSV